MNSLLARRGFLGAVASVGTAGALLKSEHGGDDPDLVREPEAGQCWVVHDGVKYEVAVRPFFGDAKVAFTLSDNSSDGADYGIVIWYDRTESDDFVLSHVIAGQSIWKADDAPPQIVAFVDRLGPILLPKIKSLYVETVNWKSMHEAKMIALFA